MLFDVILYPLLNKSYYLECDYRQRNNLIAHLKKYALRAKVSCTWGEITKDYVNNSRSVDAREWHNEH